MNDEVFFDVLRSIAEIQDDMIFRFRPSSGGTCFSELVSLGKRIKSQDVIYQVKRSIFVGVYPNATYLSWSSVDWSKFYHQLFELSRDGLRFILIDDTSQRDSLLSEQLGNPWGATSVAFFSDIDAILAAALLPEQNRV